MSLYSKEISTLITETKAPHSGFFLEIVEMSDSLVIRFFIENYDSFNYVQQRDLSIYVSYLKKCIETRGIHCDIEAM